MRGLEPSGSRRREKKRKPNVLIATPEKKYAQWAFSFSKKKETLTLYHGCGEHKSVSPTKDSRPLWIHASTGVPPGSHRGLTGKCVTPYTPISDRFSRNRRMRGCTCFAELLVPLVVLSDSLDLYEIWPGWKKKSDPIKSLQDLQSFAPLRSQNFG